MERAAREDSHLAGSELRCDERRAVLLQHKGPYVSISGEDEIVGPRMMMSVKHRAWTKVENRHAHAVASDGRKGGSVCVDDTPRREAVMLVLREVVCPVLLLEKLIDIVHSSSGPQVGDELGIGCLVNSIAPRYEERDHKQANYRLDMKEHIDGAYSDSDV